MSIRVLFILLGGLIATSASAQLRKAEEAFEHHHYKEAIVHFDKAIRKDLDNDEAITKMAICFWKTNQLPEAEYWFTRTALMNDDPEVKLMFAQVLIANKKYEKAADWLTRYIDSVTDEEKIHHASQLRTWSEALLSGAFKDDDCKVVPASVNSYALDFAPALHGGKLYFVTNRKGVRHRSGQYDPWTSMRFTDIFVADHEGSGAVGNARPAEQFPLTAFHDGPVTFSRDGNEAFATVSDFEDNKRYYDDSNNTRVRIVRFTLSKEGTWVRAEDLPFSSRAYNTAHPALSADGRTLVYASDKPGGYGGMDLYAVDRNAQGEWDTPRLLGAHINTRGNETFPFIHEDGSLYFASNWHPGFGGMDIFRSTADSEGWGVPENLGLPLNSERDDFGICFEEEGESGFLSSNRSGENKDEILYFRYMVGQRIDGQLRECASQEPIANAQITLEGTDRYVDYAFTDSEGDFSFTISEGKDFTITAEKQGFLSEEACHAKTICTLTDVPEGGVVKVQLALAEEPKYGDDLGYLCGTVRNELYGNPLPNSTIRLLHGSGEVIAEVTGSTGAFFLPARKGETYRLMVSRAGFFTAEHEIVLTPAHDGCHEVQVNLKPDRNEIPAPLVLEDLNVDEGVVIELYHIYFDRNKATLREDAIDDLETFYELLQQYPSMRGEIMAHTDSRADEAYNRNLSQRRAEAVRGFLIGKGISPDRLTAKGYGETRLINHCADGVSCSEEQHQRNRRVEFRVTSIDKDIDVKSSEGQRFSDEVQP